MKVDAMADVAGSGLGGVVPCNVHYSIDEGADGSTASAEGQACSPGTNAGIPAITDSAETCVCDSVDVGTTHETLGDAVGRGIKGGASGISDDGVAAEIVGGEEPSAETHGDLIEVGVDTRTSVDSGGSRTPEIRANSRAGITAKTNDERKGKKRLKGQSPQKNRREETVAYTRETSKRQLGSLYHQDARVLAEAHERGIPVDRLVREVASASRNRRKLIRLILDPDVRTIIVENRDRLVRGNFQLVKTLIEALGKKVIVLNENMEGKASPIDDLYDILPSTIGSIYSHIQLIKQGAISNDNVEMEALIEAIRKPLGVVLGKMIQYRLKNTKRPPRRPTKK